MRGLVFILLVGLVLGCNKRDKVTTAQTNNAVAGDTKTTLESGAHDEVFQSSSETIRLASRESIASTLVDVFGSGSKGGHHAKAVGELVVKPKVAMGGPGCDPWIADDCNNTPSLYNPTTKTMQKQIGRTVGGEDRLPSVSRYTSSRAALKTRACDLILGSGDEGVQSAIALANGGTAPSTLSVPGKAEVSQAFGLFYPGYTPSPEVVDKLMSVATKAAALPNATALEGYRFLYLALCRDPGWENL